MCVRKADGLLNDHHGGSEISELHSCLPGQQNLGVELWKCQSQIVGTWHVQPGQMSVVLARTTVSVKNISYSNKFKTQQWNT